MAGIDKTYTSSWEEYQEVIKWAREHEFTCPNGIIVKPINSCYDLKEEYFNGEDELPIMNTSNTTDYFLIKYCPLKIIQERMMEVYDEEYIEAIKNGTSKYDTFVRPEPGTKLKIIKDSKYHNRKPFSILNYYGKRVTYVTIEVRYNDELLWYNDEFDIFTFSHELGNRYNSGADLKLKSLKAIMRRIRKWKLPKGCIVDVRGRYVGEDWKFLIK